MVDAPRLVSSDASLTLPRVGGHVLDAGGAGRRLEPQPHHLRRERHDAVLRRRALGRPERPDRACDAALHEPPVAVGRVGDVGPAEGAHLAPPHPGHEEKPRDHGVEAAALEGDILGLDAAPGTLAKRRRRPPPRTAAPAPGRAVPGSRPAGQHAADNCRRLRIGLEDLRTRGSSAAGPGQTRRPPPREPGSY